MNTKCSHKDTKENLTSVRFDFFFQVEGENLHVELEHNDKLLAPGVVFETRHAKFGNLSDATIRRPNKDSCQFTGRVRGHGSSLAALSTCDGLVSTVGTQTAPSPLAE